MAYLTHEAFGFTKILLCLMVKYYTQNTTLSESRKFFKRVSQGSFYSMILLGIAEEGKKEAPKLGKKCGRAVGNVVH